MRTSSAIDPEAVRATVDRIVASATLGRSDQLVRFLRFIVAETLAGRTGRLKEYTIGVEALGRASKFDPTADSVVRVQARQLRFKLAEYYAGEGRSDLVRIELPKGSYVPVFVLVAAPSAAETAPPAPLGADVPAPPIRPVGEPAFSRGNRAVSSRLMSPVVLATAAAFVVISAISLPRSSRAHADRSGALAAENPDAVPHSVVVLPFLNLTGDPGEDYVSDGVTDELTAALANVRGLRVVARTSAYQFKTRAADVRTIGRQLGVESVVEGSVRRTGDVLRITVQLSRASDGVHLWASSFNEQSSNVLDADEGVARSVVRAIGQLVSPRVAFTAPAMPTRDSAAYTLYLKAQYIYNRRDVASVQRAGGLFQQAIDRDSTFALAYVGLGAVYATMAINGIARPGLTPPLAEAAARKALTLDPNLGQAYAELGAMRAFARWDWVGADSEFRRAIELSPSSASAHSAYAITLVARGRIDEALAHLRTAQGLDPLSYPIAYSIGEALYYARRWNEALAQAKTVSDMDTTHAGANNLRWRVYVATGRYAAALDATRQAHDTIAEVFALAGLSRLRDAREHLAMLSPERRARTPYLVACLHAALGDTDAAFDWLDRAYRAHQTDIVSMKVDPQMDPLRRDPRFSAFLRRIGLAD